MQTAFAGNRTSLTSTGSENYTTEYVYDDNNRLITETKSAGADGNVTSYTYDANGNTLTKSVVDGENGISGTAYEYNLIGQQTKSTTNGKSVCYSYNAQGTRTAKVTSNRYTSYYLDTANVAAEDVNGEVTSYIRGINFIASISEDETYYYTFNAHGDVVGLMNESNQLAKSYDYDAFGVEKNPSDEDSNPFRYCGEYYDTETGTYYLRARYYDPRIGRFTQQDTHWNTSNMIYGDNPQKINEREDKLGLKTYSYAPQISAVVQIGNLYVYAVGNPVMYADEDGEMAKLVKAAIHGLIDGVIAAMTSDAENTKDYIIDIATAFGSGFLSDYWGPIASLATSVLGGFLKLNVNNELTFESFNTMIFDALMSGLLDMKIGEITDSMFSMFSFYSSDSALDLVGIDDDFLDSILTFWAEVTNSIIGKEIDDESPRK